MGHHFFTLLFYVTFLLWLLMSPIQSTAQGIEIAPFFLQVFNLTHLLFLQKHSLYCTVFYALKYFFLKHCIVFFISILTFWVFKCCEFYCWNISLNRFFLIHKIQHWLMTFKFQFFEICLANNKIIFVLFASKLKDISEGFISASGR